MALAQPFPLAAAAQKAQQPTYGPDLAVRLICPECRDPNPNIVEEFGSGDLVCGSCGLVLGDRIVDTRSEWRVSIRVVLRFLQHCTRMSACHRRRLPTMKETIPRVSGLLRTR